LSVSNRSLKSGSVLVPAAVSWIIVACKINVRNNGNSRRFDSFQSLPDRYAGGVGTGRQYRVRRKVWELNFVSEERIRYEKRISF